MSILTIDFNSLSSRPCDLFAQVENTVSLIIYPKHNRQTVCHSKRLMQNCIICLFLLLEDFTLYLPFYLHILMELAFCLQFLLIFQSLFILLKVLFHHQLCCSEDNFWGACLLDWTQTDVVSPEDQQVQILFIVCRTCYWRKLALQGACSFGPPSGTACTFMPKGHFVQPWRGSRPHAKNDWQILFLCVWDTISTLELPLTFSHVIFCLFSAAACVWDNFCLSQI